MAGRLFLASLTTLLALAPIAAGTQVASTSIKKVYPTTAVAPTTNGSVVNDSTGVSEDGYGVSRSPLDDPDPVCHMQCHPVKHDIMVDAANWFCDQYDQSVIETSADNRFGRYYYEPATTAGTPGTYDEGVVVMQIMVTPGTDCDPVIVITKEACISWLYRTINLCPSWWFGAIRGGNITTGCLTYDITPSYYHFPICWTDDCIHNSGWPEAEDCPRPDVTFNSGPSSDFAVVEKHRSSFNDVPTHASPETRDGIKFTESASSTPDFSTQPTAVSDDSDRVLSMVNATDSGTTCYDRCFGVDRARITDAMNWMCNSMTGHAFETPEDNRVGTWNYADVHSDMQTSCACWEEGEIVLKIEIADGTICSPTIASEFNWCYDRFRMVVDGCNTDGVNGKQGGTYTDSCLTWTIDPNPWYQSECWTATCSAHDYHIICDPRPDVTSPPRIDAPVQTASASQLASSIEEILSTQIPSLHHAVSRANNQTDQTVFSDVDIAPTCYERCYGIDRSNAMAGIQWMCNIFSGHIFNTPADNVSGNWTYTPDEEPDRFCECWEEGNTFMRIDVVEGNDCSPPFTVGFDVCYDHFRTIIDGCNTGGENGKQGGELIDGCIKWSIDPNPWFSPKCWRANCEHWFSCAKRPPTL